MLNELSQEIHENAIDHGWWESEREDAELYALMHSEASEALEEYRYGRPMVYYKCARTLSPCKREGKITCPRVEKEELCPYHDSKPEGIAAELADVVIRILDYCAYKGHDMDWARKNNGFVYIHTTLPELVNDLHIALSKCFSLKFEEMRDFTNCIFDIEHWLKESDIDLWEVVRLKHEYNKTRPYRHGGKVC